jgi:hypothetical protein
VEAKDCWHEKVEKHVNTIEVKSAARFAVNIIILNPVADNSVRVARDSLKFSEN